MVTRKPIPSKSNLFASQSDSNSLPYPVTPTVSDWPDGGSYHRRGLPMGENPHTNLQGKQGSTESSFTYPPENDSTWLGGHNKESFDNQQLPWSDGNDRTSSSGRARHEDIPASLRVHQPDLTPRSSSESQRSQGGHPYPLSETSAKTNSYPPLSTNPYYRTRIPESSQPEVVEPTEDSSSDIWAELASYPPPPISAPPPPPIPQLEGDTLPLQFENLSVSDHSTHPLNTSTSKEHEEHDSPLISLEAIDTEFPERISQIHSSNSSKSPSQNAPYLDYRDAMVQNDRSRQDPTDIPVERTQTLNSQRNSKNKELPVMPMADSQGAPPYQVYEGDENNEIAPPELPPRRSHDQEDVAPPQPPRPPPIGVMPYRPDADLAKKQRGETYQIKHIIWVDSSSPTLRTSPIMIQNANGPCPLLALVNALTISTPANLSTALIETLRVREQVSLGLLLDAVFDELMSGRRGDSAQELPDVGELYSFLITLHTGMNVNPRFMPFKLQQLNLMDADDSNLPVATSSARRPGGFEETREMKLYSTFSIPLIHGWLPPRNHPAFTALERSAPSYEDAQNLMFREEELEDKLQRDGLNQDEQLCLEDIASIKYFLSSSATQLTGYGLDTITEALTPGSIAILFRNDHFSTLYRHPRSGQLLTLVTDMGYASHAEVVWESLVDVRGEGCEFFAGDFRPVGNTSNDTPKPGNSPALVESGWQTVSYSSRNGTNPASKMREARNQGIPALVNPQRLPTSPADNYDLPTSPNIEQEDHDLALAMQLQEEEEDRSRREVEARRREDELSRAYLESQEPTTRRGNSNTGRDQVSQPLVPPRGGSSVASQGSRNAPPRTVAPTRQDPEAGEDAPPPSYEQAAKSLPYNPPTGQPYPSSLTVVETNTLPNNRPQGTRPRQVSAYSQQASLNGNTPSNYGRRESTSRNPLRGGSSYGADGVPGVVRRRSTGITPGSFEENDDGRGNKDCIVM